VYPRRPILGVGAVVFHDDRVLLIRRGKQPSAGEWSIPGGRLEPGESVTKAAVREVREETGAVIRTTGFIGAFESIRRDAAGRVLYHYVLVDVMAEAECVQLRVGSDASDAGWFAPDALDGLGLWSETLGAIRRASGLRGQ
jgi:ADP-ribose pyrophosphatase YjhB (NUDIX family)